MQLIAVRRHKQIAASSLTMSCGISQSGKKGFAAYSANTIATIACKLMNENYHNLDMLFSAFYGSMQQIALTRVKLIHMCQHDSN